MFKRILIALAILQAVFLLTALFAYETFYWEASTLTGLFILTPFLGIGLGGLLAFSLSEGNGRQALLIWLVCILAALPAYMVSMEVGNQVRNAGESAGGRKT